MSPSAPKHAWICFALALFSGCGGGSNGVPVPSKAVARIGPAGGRLRGPTGSRLQGVEVRIPQGALTKFVAITLELAPDLSHPAGAPVSIAVKLTTDDDPGLLLDNLEIRIPVVVDRFVKSDDLMLLVSKQIDVFGGASQTIAVPGAPAAGLVRNEQAYEGLARRFASYQVFRTHEERKLLDAAALIARAFDELGKRTNNSLHDAGLILREALKADPFSDEARFFAAVLRLADLLNDRSDSSPAIDSFGELLEDFGLDLASKSLLRRVVESDFESRLKLPHATPTQAQIAGFFESVAIPELRAIRFDLAEVSEQLVARRSLPDFGFGFIGEREFDLGDVNAFETLVTGLLFAVDVFASLDADVDLAAVLRGTKYDRSVEGLLARYSELGKRRAARLDRAGFWLDRAFTHVIDGFLSIENESDDQSDDFLVIDPTMGFQEREQFLDRMRRFRSSLRDPGPQEFRQYGRRGTVAISLYSWFRASGLDVRAMLPQFLLSFPRGETLPDPTFGGLFPAMTLDEAISRGGLPNSATLVDATIAIDGKRGDWPAEAEVLRPRDEIDDANGPERLAAFDGTALFLARSGQNLAVRLDLADGDPAVRQGIAHVYGIRIRDVSGAGPSFEAFATTSPLSAWLVDSAKLPDPLATGPSGVGTRIDMAFGPGTVELAIPLSQLRRTLGARKRVVEFFTLALDENDGTAAQDASRMVLIEL